MKQIITVFAVLLLFTSAIPQGRKEASKPLSNRYNARQVNVAYDSLGLSLDRVNEALKLKP